MQEDAAHDGVDVLSFRLRFSGRQVSPSTAPTLLRSAFDREAVSFPKTERVPASGRTSPRMLFIVVLFPAPFSPMNPTTEPRGTEKVTSSREKPLNFF